MKHFFRTLFALLTLAATLYAKPSSLLLPGASNEGKVALHNRILAQINEKNITMLDVMQKMTLYLQKNYPEQAKSPLARSQFFISSWRDFFHQMVDQELILADAKRIDLKVLDKDVREAMMGRFGPNTMTTLNDIGLPYEKAKELITEEILIDRMNWFKIHSKAMELVGPQAIKEAYKEYLAHNPPVTELTYQVLSIRSQDSEKAHTLAKKAHALLKDKSVEFASIEKHLENTSDEVSVSLSSPYQMKESELSDAHRSALSVLSLHEISTPAGQTSRFDGSTVVRIFYLQDVKKTLPRPFSEMEKELRDELFAKVAMEKTHAYVAKLREQFGFDENSMPTSLPDDYEPFSVQ